MINAMKALNDARVAVRATEARETVSGGGGEAIAGALTEALKAALTNSQISVQIGMPT